MNKISSSVTTLKAKGRAAKEASRKLAYVSTDIKNKALLNIAADLLKKKDEILAANKMDFKEGEASGLGAAMLDRLMLDEKRLEGIAADTRAVAALPDPVGEVFDMRTMPNGLHGKKRVPSASSHHLQRPNVGGHPALCLKSGNAGRSCAAAEGRLTNTSSLK
jgi:glutamate-5-semialdehyde dehydrogenase